ncbi:MAG: hypothetical protein U0930_09450 [Pirellulales bacterium]
MRNWLEFSAKVLKFTLLRLGVCRAIAGMDRQQVQAIPNVSMFLAAGYDEATKISIGEYPSRTADAA